MSRSAQTTTRREQPIRAAAQHSPYGPCSGRGPHSQPRKRDGCLTCRLRRKRCSDRMHEAAATLPCTNCRRLHIECLGYSDKRPRWMTGNLGAIRADIKSFTRPFTQPSPSTKGFFSFRKYYENDPSFNASFPIDGFGTMYDTLSHDAGEEEDSNPSSDHDDNETSTQSSTHCERGFSFPPHLVDDSPSFTPSNDSAAPSVNDRGSRPPALAILPQLPSDNESSQGTTSPEPHSPIEPPFYRDVTTQTRPHPHMYGFNGATTAAGSSVNPAISDPGMAMALYSHFQPPSQYDAGVWSHPLPAEVAPFYPAPYVPRPIPDDANSYPNSGSTSSHNFDAQLLWGIPYQQL